MSSPYNKKHLAELDSNSSNHVPFKHPRRRWKTYSCDKCGAEFSSRRTYGNHYKTVHGQGAFFCDVCGRRITRHDNITSHQRSCQRQPPEIPEGMEYIPASLKPEDPGPTLPGVLEELGDIESIDPSILSFGHEELNAADADAVGFDPSLLPTACFELELMAQDICGRAAQCMADIENFRSKVLYWRENFWRKGGTRRSFQ
ncbi:hypothetical protein TWF225_002194 [Orbilia oligospora]|uniref:C2H2-type domain-containing protein n=2 Tax=Orbilia oligospora TaxID=2813651 RepID=A0A8H2DSC9_ORBOL|nr:hypothetical protein TWF225_002194 [Orbilia oligospora]KAF3242660.1 hypothetical protein TWF217_011517 [Orbilia oligospora]KAF3257949.1 hypothetical protein TWF128_004854 [Orbilia oligospora]KAF3286397.1 hypothetical protein TWF132_008965 [Orbilia oligospora]TGJ65842.1 hypothetical protein EYR41_009785 [Orbilia oligospora]